MNFEDLRKQNLDSLLFNILEKNMESIYTSCSGEWKREEKLEEFCNSEGKYLIAFEGDTILGFCYFTFQKEGKADVIYCYELQVLEEYRGNKIGVCLMEVRK